MHPLIFLSKPCPVWLGGDLSGKLKLDTKGVENGHV